MVAAAPAVAVNPPEPVHWTLGTDDLGDYAMTDDKVLRLGSARTESGLALLTFDARGHQILEGLVVPFSIGPPDARGAKLEFVGVEDPNIRLKFLDNDAAVTDVACADPPEPVLPPNPCKAQFPAGHSIRVVQTNRQSSVLEVVMANDAGAIIPCVRVVVHGAYAIEDSTLAFAGDMRLNALGIDDPNI